MIVWGLNIALICFIAGFLAHERLGGGLQVVFQRAVYDEPKSVVFGVQVRRGAVA